MKKLSLLMFALLILSTSAFAQRRNGNNNNDELVLRDGRRVLRIQVGDDRDDREMLKRIIRLERAVADLQDKVYDLQSAPIGRDIVVCSGTFFSAGTIISKAPSQTEARANVMRECAAKTNSMFCEARDIVCENSRE